MGVMVIWIGRERETDRRVTPELKTLTAAEVEYYKQYSYVFQERQE